ncbi:TetR/AcrR family transcriptional regulator [Gammaproteobacteria bacterium]|nr:TetR/AcrR family transcriptional regulator [Gammaproteobacteria bacterium]
MAIKKKRNREKTRQLLIDVALKLIQEKGVLTGLNLQEVAEGAGVTRGNIYHYFGSRQELLRAAITGRFEQITKILDAPIKNDSASSFEHRLQLLSGKGSINDSLYRAILVADGDEEVDPMPLFETLLSSSRQDVIDGYIDPSHDLEALQVALTAMLRGYRIFHKQFAKRIDTDIDDLDERVTKIMRTWLEKMANPPTQ